MGVRSVDTEVAPVLADRMQELAISSKILARDGRQSISTMDRVQAPELPSALTRNQLNVV